MRILRSAVAETAGNKTIAKTVETGRSALEQMLSDEPPTVPEKNLEAEKQPEGREAAAPGETVDISHEGGGNRQDAKNAKEQTPEQLAAEAEEAKAAGMSVEDFRTAHAAEKERTDAITAKTGESLEEIYAREDKDGKLTEIELAQPKGTKTFTQQEVEQAIAKRVKNLASENADLKRQLEAKPVTAAATDFEQQEAAAQSGLDQADDLLEQLRTEPDSVEAVLRKWMGDKANGADLSVGGMRQIIRNAKRGFERQLQQAGQSRQQFSAIRQNVEKLLSEPELAKAIPFVTNADTDEHAQFQQLRKLPQLASHPRGDYLAAALVVGMKQLAPTIQQIADRQAGKKPAPSNGHVKLRLKSKLPGTGAAGAGAGKSGKTTFAAAKAKGDVNAMAEAIGLD